MARRQSTKKPAPTGLLAKVKGTLQCTLGNHEPDRHKVKRDGIFYMGHCQRCGVAIRKRNGQPWTVIEPDNDFD